MAKKKQQLRSLKFAYLSFLLCMRVDAYAGICISWIGFKTEEVSVTNNKSLIISFKKYFSRVLRKTNNLIQKYNKTVILICSFCHKGHFYS